jgi:hypothetical protein
MSVKNQIEFTTQFARGINPPLLQSTIPIIAYKASHPRLSIKANKGILSVLYLKPVLIISA